LADGENTESNCQQEELITIEMKLIDELQRMSAPIYNNSSDALAAGWSEVAALLYYNETRNPNEGCVDEMEQTFEIDPDQGSGVPVVTTEKIGTKWVWKAEIPEGWWTIRFWK
jgi:hypothetical protein